MLYYRKGIKAQQNYPMFIAKQEQELSMFCELFPLDSNILTQSKIWSLQHALCQVALFCK